MTTPPQGGSPPAGWYPDPQGTGQQRYWDGSQWTQNVAPGTGAGPGAGPGGGAPLGSPKAPPGTRGVPLYLALASCLLLVIGSFGTWYSVGELFSESGVEEGTGWITLVGTVISAALLGWWATEGNGWKPVVAAVLGGLMVLVCLIDLSDTVSGDAAELIDAGWGLILAQIGSIALTILAIVLRVTQARA